jgi:hypothetical protein
MRVTKQDLRALLICALLGIIAALCVPVSLRPAELITVTLTATGERNPAARSSEVWVDAPAGTDVVRLGTRLSEESGWEEKDSKFVSYRNQPATLELVIDKARSPYVRLQTHPFCGKVLVSVAGVEKEFDLYSASPAFVTFPLTPYMGSMRHYSGPALKFLGAAVVAASVFLLIAVAAGWRTAVPRLQERLTTRKLWFDTLVFSVPSFTIYVVVHLAFWPGQMSPDSIEQWRELVEGPISDAHSAFLAGIYSILIQLSKTPALLVVFQYTLLSVAWGFAIASLGEFGARRRVQYLFALLFPLFPASHLLATTLWKDVPFAALAVLLAGMTIRLVADLEPPRLRQIVLILLVALALALVRHNGIVIVTLYFVSAGTYFWIRRSERWLIAGLPLVVSAFLVIKLVVYPLLGVVPIGAAYKAMHATHIVGAMVANGVPMSNAQRIELERVMSLDDWRSSYDCKSVVPLFWHPRVLDFLRAPANVDGMNRMAHDLVRGNIRVALTHQICVTSLLWRITSNEREHVSISPLETTELDSMRRLNLGLSPVLPQFRNAMLATYEKHVFNRPLFGRPAAVVMLGIAATLLLAIYGRSEILFGFSVAIWNMVSLSVLMSAQDYRYQFLSVALSFLALCAVFALPRKGPPARELC